jgi:transcriptional regulator with XRE-family HTH domain
MKKQNIFLSANVKHLRLRKQWRQEELAEKVKISRSKLALLETGKTINPPLEDVINFSAAFSISVDSLLKVDLSKLSERKLHELEAGNDTYATGTNIRVLATTVDKDNNNNAELVPEKAKAGYRSSYSDPEWIAELPRYAIPGLSKHSKYRIFPITGDSMLPYPDGCYIVGEYVEDWINLKDDALCVLILKSGGADFVFKQVENRIKKEKKLLAKSLNLVYQPYEIPIGDVLEVWKYKLHIAATITCPKVGVSFEQLIRMMQEIKLELGKLTGKVET